MKKMTLRLRRGFLNFPMLVDPMLCIFGVIIRAKHGLSIFYLTKAISDGCSTVARLNYHDGWLRETRLSRVSKAIQFSYIFIYIVRIIKSKTLILMMVYVARRKRPKPKAVKKIPGMAGRASHLRTQIKNTNTKYKYKIRIQNENTNTKYK